MTTLTIQIDDGKVEALREKAARLGVAPEQLITASVDDLIAQPDQDFDEAAERVLSKNKELYNSFSKRRLKKN